MTATIDRFHVTWAVEAEETGDGDRFARLLDALVTEALDDALVAAGMGGHNHEELCVLRVDVARQVLHRDRPDADFLTRWAAAIAGALAEAVSDRGGDGVVLYRSRHHALSDFACRLAAGDTGRAWAWRQLGLWPADLAPADALATALAAHPHAIVGAFESAARAGLLARLLGLLGAELLGGLAAAAWRAAGGTGEGLVAAVSSVVTTDADVRRARSLLGATALGTSLPGLSLTTLGQATETVPAAVSAALAVLAVLDAEPARAAQSSKGTSRMIAAVAAVLFGATGAQFALAPAAEGDATAPAISEQPRPAAHDPAAEATTTSGGRSDGSRTEPGPQVDPVPNPAPAPARTAWGGLLFLLHPLGALDPAGMAADDTVLAEIPLPRLLHHLGTVILHRAVPDVGPPDPHDPALLAFCGLAPDAPAPEPPDPMWSERVEAWAERLLAVLRTALDPSDLASEPEDRLLLAVCRRRAEIVADPGWIDVRLDLDEVEVEVRRAGLDLDPGYVPWLGCVVRFVYG